MKAAQDISTAFRVSGTIQKIHVEDGACVRTGQLLAELDPADYQVQLDATAAEYEQIKAEAERVMALYKENGTTPNANDKAVYGLKQITAKYQHHKDQLAYTRLYAPFDGFVQKHLFETHETVGAGMPVISMISAGIPEVEINLPAAEYIHGTNSAAITVRSMSIGQTLSIEAHQHYAQGKCQPTVLHAPANGAGRTTLSFSRNEYDGHHLLRYGRRTNSVRAQQCHPA